MNSRLIFFSRGTQPDCWRAYCQARGLAAPLRVASLPQLRAIAPGTAAVLFWRGGGGDGHVVLPHLLRVLAPAGLAAIAMPAGVGETAGRALDAQLHASGFATVASRRDGDTLWAVASRAPLGADAMGALAGQLMPSTPGAAPRAELQAVLRQLGAGAAAAAQEASRALLQRFPADGTLWDFHGVALLSLDRNDAARLAFERACQLRPRDAGLWEHHGLALTRLSLFAQAGASFERSLALHPGSASALSNAAKNASDSGDFPAAARYAAEACALDPSLYAAWCNQGKALMEMQQLNQAARCFAQALALQAPGPAAAHLHSALLFCLSHDPAVAPEAAFAAHQAYGRRYDAPVRAHPNGRDPARTLRVGFVSGDLRNHAVPCFIAPVWAALGRDRDSIELIAYASHGQEDEVTASLRGLCHAWRQVARLDDDALEAQIRADRIDVLFDLSGHTLHNRLPVFARKPAPLQVTWIGYPNTTGLAAMDYVLCDRFNAPHGLYEHLYTEKFARLPSSGSFAAPAGAPAPNGLPALATGRITFCSFNRAEKIGEHVVATWSRVLHQVPGARMLLGNMSAAGPQRTMLAWFARHGIGPERLAFHPALPLADYLRLHHEADIMLDAWPYTGGTTTNFALWMGVPVLTLQGPTRAHCQSAAVLGRMGMGDWVAKDSDQFVRLAVQWAHAPAELAALRAGMRARWDTARLRQPGTVARGLARALRHMWQRWCAGLPADHFDIELDQEPHA
ncbi:MAG: hypothetical protein V4633_19825 [Pseudomonadota bacterium]